MDHESIFQVLEASDYIYVCIYNLPKIFAAKLSHIEKWFKQKVSNAKVVAMLKHMLHCQDYTKYKLY